MDNPFVYGQIVTGPDFCDREKEQQELVRDLASGERIFLISPRRYGKSSLIAQTAEKLKKRGLLVASFDLFSVSSPNQLLETYSQAVSRAAENTVSGFTKFVRDFLAGIRPKVVIGPDGRPKIEVGFDLNKKEALAQLTDVCDLPQKIAQKRKKRFVVIIDEFQEISALGGEKIEKAMRSVMQRHNLVSYLFAGSKRHLMYSLVTDRSRAFYKMGRIMNLDKIPAELFRAYLEDKFKRTGYKLDSGVVETVLQIAENYPYNVQFICHKLWNLRLDSKTISRPDVALAIAEILNDQNMAYIALWETLSNHQKRLLVALARWGGENILSAEFIKRAGLSAPSSVQTSKSILLKRDLIDKEEKRYFIADTFFKEWILKKIAN